jgi:hypothetical protein
VTFRRGGAKKRRDANEPVILHALEAMGVQTWQLSGRAVPDVLCWFRGRPYVFEVKTATGKLQPSQVGTPWPVVRTVAEAAAVVFGR